MALFAITARIAVKWDQVVDLYLLCTYYRLIFSNIVIVLKGCVLQGCVLKFDVHSEYMELRVMLLHHGQDHTDSTFHHSGRVPYEYNTSKVM